MDYRYPSPRTGTAQDLMRLVTLAYEERMRREGTVLPLKTEFQRRFLEPLARAGGMAVAAVVRVIPAEWAITFHDLLFSKLAGGRRYSFDPRSAEVAAAAALAASLEARTGRAPALLAAISHPPVLGEFAHLSFELVRHSTHALRAVRGRPCRPRLVTAIDPFALDTASLVDEGLYAGFMGTYHVGIDRLAFGRGEPGPYLTRLARWDRMPTRLLRTLGDGGEVGMVLAGGVPETARVLYGVREWARRARGASALRRDPKAALRALRADASFARFEAALASRVHLLPGSWRLLDAWLMASAAGLLPDETAETAAKAALEALAVEPAQRPRLMKELARDFERDTPARRRLFRVLCARVLRRRPLVLLPIVHATAPAGVAPREAWSVEKAAGGRVSVRRASSPGKTEEMTPEALAERFTEENFA